MLKVLSVTLLITSTLTSGYIITPAKVSLFDIHQPTTNLKQWGHHEKGLLDFINTELLFPIILDFIKDPQMMNILSIATSSEFNEKVINLLTSDEFKELLEFLESKGIDTQLLTNLIDQLTEQKPSKTNLLSDKDRKGLIALIQEIFATISIEDIKEFIKNKIESNPILANLLQSLNTEQLFANILDVLADSKMLQKIKQILATFGITFDQFCEIFNGIFGKIYDGKFCKNTNFGIRLMQ
ncbi:hypothetical protein ACJJTC_009839 [Scirpophaga incertulas]